VIEVPIVTNVEHISTPKSHRSLTDIVPTILRELGVEESFDFDGNPLQDELNMGKPVLSQEVAYGPNQISVTDAGNHLIYVPMTDQSIVIDFQTGERIDDSDIEEQLLSCVPRDRKTGSDVDLSDEVKNRLSDLGYAE
jgi:hypothetical protein